MSRASVARRLMMPAVVALVAVSAFTQASALDEGELLRQIKTDVFDRQWPAVLSGCDEFIQKYSRSQAVPRAYYYRAQALESLRRPEEAIEAYGEFLDRFPGVSKALREDSTLSRITLATELYKNGNKKNLMVIMDGMDLSGYPQIFAAIQASKIEYRPGYNKAKPVLLDCARFESDEEIRSECKVAILRIDPELAGELDDDPTPRVRVSDECKLIRVEVFDKEQNKTTVKVNLPIAFAEIAIQSLAEVYKGEVLKEMFPDGPPQIPNIDQWIAALAQGCPQTLAEIDNVEFRIKVWIE